VLMGLFVEREKRGYGCSAKPCGQGFAAAAHLSQTEDSFLNLSRTMARSVTKMEKHSVKTKSKSLCCCGLSCLRRQKDV
jgi:hypothetical protein